MAQRKKPVETNRIKARFTQDELLKTEQEARRQMELAGIKQPDAPAVYRFEEYLNVKTFQMCPVNDEVRERLAIELVKWAEENSKAYKLSQFYISKGIPMTTFFEWCQRCPSLETARKTALQIIGNRREVGGLERKLDASLVRFSMPIYDSEWDEQEQKSRRDNQASATNQIIIIEKVPDSPLVPKKAVDPIEDKS